MSVFPRIQETIKKKIDAENREIELEAMVEDLISHIPEDNKRLRAIYTPVAETMLHYVNTEITKNKELLESWGQETALPSTTNPNLLSCLPEISMRILDNLMPVYDLVGCQPMRGPVGLIYNMEYKESGEEGDEYLDDTRRLSFEVCKHAVEAGSRKFKAALTLEALQDMFVGHGQFGVDELILALASELAVEIKQEILSDLRNLGRETDFQGEQFVPKFEPKSKNVAGIGKEIFIQINKASSEIAFKTRRGAGNFIVVSPIMVSVLQATFMPTDTFVPATEEEGGSQFGELQLVGTLNGRIKVYADIFAPETGVLVGYKGTNDLDTGYNHCPYLMITTHSPVVDPHTFQPRIPFMTRYGKWTKHNDAMMGNSKSFYNYFTVETENLFPSREEEDCEQVNVIVD